MNIPTLICVCFVIGLSYVLNGNGAISQRAGESWQGGGQGVADGGQSPDAGGTSPNDRDSIHRGATTRRYGSKRKRWPPMLPDIEHIQDIRSHARNQGVSGARWPRSGGRSGGRGGGRSGGRGGGTGGRHNRRRQDLALWIDHEQVELLSGYPMEIYVIREGRVLPYIMDPNFNSRLPVIPAEVSSFNFTWQGGHRKRYRYQLDNLLSANTDIMENPKISIPNKGRLPKKPRGFRIELPCVKNASGVARFTVRLKLKTRQARRLQGTPISVRLRKRCAPVEMLQRNSQCHVGYLGPDCSEALCYPHCLHGGTCTAPGRCSCPLGYHGRYCQGGICADKCLNGGKCIQKDRCSCTRGFYGPTCQYSKCVVPCVNDGVCRGANKCRCPSGFGGHHCEVVKWRGSVTARAKRCHIRCKHGACDDVTAQCQCTSGYSGRWCGRRERDRRPRVWL